MEHRLECDKREERQWEAKHINLLAIPEEVEFLLPNLHG